MASNIPVKSTEEPVTYTCVLCDSADSVNWYCNDCQEALCDRCKEVHTRGKKTKNDDVVSIGEVDRQGEKPVPEVCKVHPGKLCDLYCCDCDMLICLMCFSETHEQHKWKHFEDEYIVREQLLKEQTATLSATLEHFQNVTSQKHRASEASKDNLDNNGNEVNFQRTKIKAEIDSIADAVLAELSSLEKKESAMYENYCEQSEKKIEELTQLIEKVEMSNTSGVSRFELESLLQTALPLYDDLEDDVLPELPNYVAGNIDRGILRQMVGEFTPQAPIPENGHQPGTGSTPP